MISALRRTQFAQGIAVLFALCFTLSAQADPPVHLVTEQELTQKKDTELAKYVTESKIDLLDPDRHPSVGVAMQKTRALLGQMFLPIDGDAPFHLIFSPNMSVNASFAKLKNGERVVTLTLGLLNFCESDDEIAFALGHELEHGPSELQEAINRNRYRDNREFLEALQRAVENEADVKSVVRRVRKPGLNPYASIRMLNRLAIKYPDSAPISHTTSNSRADAVGAALAYQRKELGDRIVADDPATFKHEILGPLKSEFLDAPVFMQQQNAALEKIYAGIPGIFDSYYIDVRDDAHYARQIGKAFEWEGHARMSRIRGLFEGKLSPREFDAIQMKLNLALDAEMQKSRSTILGDNFKPQSAEQFAALQAESFVLNKYPGSGYGLEKLEDNVQQAEYRVRRDRYNLANATTKDAKQEAQSLLLQSEKKLAQAKEDFEYRLSLYDDKVPALLDKLHSIRSTSRQTGLHETLQEIEERQLGYGPLRARDRQRTRDLYQSDLTPLFTKGKDLQNLWEVLGMISMEAPDVLKGKHKEVLRGILQITKNHIAREATSKNPYDRIESSMLSRFWGGEDTNYGDSEYRKMLERFCIESPEEGHQWFREYWGTLLDRAHTQNDLEAILIDIKPMKLGKYSTVADKGSGNLIFTPEFAREIFTPELMERYILKLAAITSAEFSSKNQNANPSNRAQRYAEQIGTLAKSGNLEKAFSRPAVVKAHKSLLHKYAELLTKTGRLSPSEAEAALFLRTPELFSALPAKNRPTFQKAVQILAKVSNKNAVLDGLIPYGTLHDTYFSSLTTQEWTQTLLKLKGLISYHRAFDSLGKELPWKFISELLSIYSELEKLGVHQNPEVFKIATQVLNFFNPGTLERLSAPEKTAYLSKRDALYTTSFDRTLARHSKLPKYEAIEAAFGEQYQVFQTWGGMKDLIESWYPKDPVERLQYFNAHYRGLRKVFKGDSQSMRFSGGFPDTEKFLDSVLAQIRTGKLKDASPELMVDTFDNLGKLTWVSAKMDDLFAEVWKRTEGHPARERFRAPEFVRRLMFDDHKKTLALWQLEREFEISSKGQLMRKQRSALPTPQQMRSEITKIRDFVDLQFENPSGQKNDVLEFVENNLITNDAETAHFKERKLRLENWHQSRKLVFLDSFDQLNHYLQSNFDRLDLIRYVIGVQDEVPRFIQRGNTTFATDENVAKLRHLFVTNDIYVRTWLMQPLLNQRFGILSEPAIYEELVALILGDRAKDPVFRKLFDAYIKSVPESEAKLIIGRILGSFADSRQRKASIKVILEAMGPFGIKAGQFLRTSGLVGPELRAELDGFFNRALQPNRDEVFARLKKAFGENFVRSTNIWEVVGSGSINFVVLAEVKDPASGRIRSVVVRLLRDHVEGKLANENEIWEKAIAELRKDPDAATRRLAEGAEEARKHTYSTLGPGGAELDLQIELAAHPDAQESYARKNTKSGFAIEVSRPDAHAQKLVVESEQSRTSVYEFVPSTDLVHVPKELQKKIAMDLVESELRAIFVKGIFDPDGHPGNWLIDLHGKRLVRIDYGQLHRLPPQDVNSLKRIYAALLQPSIGKKEVQALTEEISKLFEIDGPTPDIRSALMHIVQGGGLPDFKSPHERILFFREALESYYRGSKPPVRVRITPAAQKILASISRVSIYREQIGDSAYLSILLESLGVNQTEFFGQLATRELSTSVSKAWKFVTGCVKRALRIEQGRK